MNVEIHYETTDGIIYPHFTFCQGEDVNLRYKIEIPRKGFSNTIHTWYCYDLKLALASLKAFYERYCSDYCYSDYKVTHGKL